MTVSQKLLILAKTTAFVGALCFATTLSPTTSLARSLEWSSMNGNSLVDNTQQEMQTQVDQARTEREEREAAANPTLVINGAQACPEGTTPQLFIQGTRVSAMGGILREGTEVTKCVPVKKEVKAVEEPKKDDKRMAAAPGRGTTGGSGGMLGSGGNGKARPSFTPTISGGEDEGLDCSEANRKARRLASDLGTPAEADASMTARGVVVRDILAERKCKAATSKAKTEAASLKG